MKNTFKKVLALALSAVLVLALTACTPKTPEAEGITIRVGASPTPHAQILEQVKPILAEQGITLEIVEFTDYVQPNLATADGSLDANYFQHIPYLDWFCEENDLTLVSVGGIHFEPMGVYPGRTATIEDLPDGAVIGIPNDTTNEARALFLLQDLGLITLPEDAELDVTPRDIIDNPKNLVFQELEAAQLTLSLPDLDLAVINGNYAVSAGIQETVLTLEDKDSLGAQTYVNVLVVNAGDENNEAILALYEALTSEEVRTYIEETWADKSVIAVF
jgi:ABC-type metal ion transport system, periplasmic component/surface antigen